MAHDPQGGLLVFRTQQTGRVERVFTIDQTGRPVRQEHIVLAGTPAGLSQQLRW